LARSPRSAGLFVSAIALNAAKEMLHDVGGHVHQRGRESKTDDDAEDENQNGFHLSLSENEDPAPRSLKSV
jgi:hypothetical protein